VKPWQGLLVVHAVCGLALHAAGPPGTGSNGEWVVALRNPRARPLDEALARVGRDGRYVALSSSAALTADDDSPGTDVYVMDLTSGLFTLESGSTGGRPSNGDSAAPGVSDDGRFVVFESSSQTLVVPHEDGTLRHVYARDRRSGITTRLSVTPEGASANDYSASPVISADGTTVVFQSAATDLAPLAGKANQMDVFLVRLADRQPQRVSVDSDGRARHGQSHSPAINADGRYVVFTSMADLTTRPQRADINRLADVYLRDTLTSTTTRLSLARDGRDADGRSYQPAISDDGQVVVFVSDASNLTAERVGRQPQIYAYDRRTGQIALVSRQPGGGAADGASVAPHVSGDGQLVIFQSLASNLACARRCGRGEQDTNMVWDVFVHDRRTGSMKRVTADAGGGWADGGRGPSIDARGTVATFSSRHPRSEDDTGLDEDLFVRRLR
jgi:Tol biopolymer transport system component